ncbi:SRPBCC family protein [Isoptericola jiangsuensis]|uniref:SRPBCC family protein n=1 Tax=Isoptericola jiangsuensis TaxID=548579 RepID=UPI003AAB3530
MAAPYRVEASRIVDTDAATAFAWVADARTHPRWIPLTVCAERDLGTPHVGQAFTMVSGPAVRRSRRGFTDRMVVTELDPPTVATDPSGTRRVGRTRVRKLGPVLLGESGFDVVAVDEARTRLVWWEEAYLAGPWPRRANARAVGLVLRVMLHVSLHRLARELRRSGG